MTTQTQEQILFNILSKVNEKFCLREDKFDAYLELLPVELINYIKLNYKNKKAITRLTAYLYLTMENEFNQFFIENELNDMKILKYDGTYLEEETNCIINLIADLEDNLRCYE